MGIVLEDGFWLWLGAEAELQMLRWNEHELRLEGSDERAFVEPGHR